MKHPIIRAEAITIILTMVGGLIALVYTFSTSYASNRRVDRVEDVIREDLQEVKRDLQWIKNHLIEVKNGRR